MTFPCSTGRQGWREATDDLHARGAPLVDEDWVQNHWSLIVWKVGCLVKAKPNELENWWTYDEILRQLLYRYSYLSLRVKVELIVWGQIRMGS